MALLCFNPDISQHGSVNVSLPSSSVLASLLCFSIPVVGNLSPVNLKSVREEICDEVWSTEFEANIKGSDFNLLKREIICRNSFSNLMLNAQA